MRSISVPLPITPPATGKALPFAEFVVAAIRGDKVSGHGVENIRRAIRVLEAAEKADGHLVLEEADWQHLRGAIDRVEWTPAVVTALGPYLDAVEEADEVKG